MEFIEEDIRNAYLKLKSYLYYDTSELFQRRQLAIFETGLEENIFGFGSIYNFDNLFWGFTELPKFEEKFKKITLELNRVCL
jgi:hypothetical protein